MNINGASNAMMNEINTMRRVSSFFDAIRDNIKCFNGRI
jgi:hypothetical protein